MQIKNERFELRLDQTTLDKVDRWRDSQDGALSRAEAVRRLMELGLEREKPALRFSASEKLIVTMLRDIYRHFKIQGDIDAEFVTNALLGGHNWGLQWKYGLADVHEDSPRVVAEVVDILDMWSFIEEGYAALSEADKAKIAKEFEPFPPISKWPGFDGNNETEYLSVARFMVEDLDRFSSFEGRGGTNSHMPIIDLHRRMLAVFDPIRRTLIGVKLNVSQLVQIFKAQTHPSNRIIEES